MNVVAIKVRAEEGNFILSPIEAEIPEGVFSALQEDFTPSYDGVWHPVKVAAARISAATGYPDTHYGGVGWYASDRGAGLFFSLPGGGAKARLVEEDGFDLEICSFGDVVRAVVAVGHHKGQVTAEVRAAFEPRKRDMARARMWASIARGVDPRSAARAEHLGDNIGHAHAGFPPLKGEESAFETAVRLLRKQPNLVRDEAQVYHEAGRRFVHRF